MKTKDQIQEEIEASKGLAVRTRTTLRLKPRSKDRSTC